MYVSDDTKMICDDPSIARFETVCVAEAVTLDQSGSVSLASITATNVMFLRGGFVLFNDTVL
jgi:hypothetical protein